MEALLGWLFSCWCIIGETAQWRVDCGPMSGPIDGESGF
jgi:hypothetical protein